MKAFGIRWRLYRRGEPDRGWREAAILFAAYVVTLAAGVLWSRSVENSTAMWTANGVLTAGLLLLRPRVGWTFVAGCIALNLGINVASGLPGNLNLAFTAMNLAFSVVVAVLVRTFCGAALDLGRLRRFLPFVGIVCGVALIEGAIGAGFTTPQGGRWATIWLRWAACDGAGMVLALPAALLMMRRVNPLYSGIAGGYERAGLMLGLAALTTLTFSVSSGPYVLLIYPALLFAAFRLGSAWTFLSVGLVAQIATVMTLRNLGPIAVFDGAPPFRELGLLHLFLGSLLLAGTLATSHLAERMRTEQRARRKDASAAAIKARSEQVTATRQRFLAVVGHEIRTPLNGIVAFAAMLASRDDLPADVRRQVEGIAGSAGDLTGLIEDVLDFSRLETNRLELERAAGSVSDVLADATARSRPAAEAKGLDLALVVEGESAARHLIDARRLRQVIGGLVDNAVKFTGAGSVAVRAVWSPAGEGRDRLTVQVMDSGPGVPEARRRELFQPFAQMDASLSRQHSGVGLGLAMCRSVVGLMGGEIGYAPRPEGGSCFWMTVDLERAAAAGAAPAPTPEAIEEERAARILVVDDHPTNREVARMILTACGCEVVEAEDGARAVAAVEQEAFDAILMDVRMPGMDGLEATRAIRALGGPAAATPILAVTADAMRDDVARCRAAGMDGHLAKPVNPARLMAALGAVLRGEQAFPADGLALAEAA